MTSQPKIVIVGAGPAGIRAAQALVEAGLCPVVLDENARWGGQIYRQPPAHAGFGETFADKRRRYGFDARKAHVLHETMAALCAHIDYRPNTLAWGCEAYAHSPTRSVRGLLEETELALGGQLDTLRDGRECRVPFTHLVIASGATDRVLPVAGWTLPGVYTLGGAQTALKAQQCAIGKRIVFAGTGPLLYLVAYQYAQAGVEVAAVLDTSPFTAQVSAVGKLATEPATLAKGLFYVGWLRSHGVPIEHGVTLGRVLGERHVTGLAWRTDGHAGDKRQEKMKLEKTLECDAVGLGFGLRPETQLADLAGCAFRFDAANDCWVPKRDAAGRSSIPGIYLAGDGAAIAGADAAAIAGRRAALALLDDLGVADAGERRAHEAARLERRLARLARFRSGIDTAFPIVPQRSLTWPDSMTVCRCEEVDAGTLRRCVREQGAMEVNRLKALTRVGMGRCQGRMCGDAARLLLADETGLPRDAVGRLRAQAPIKPVPLALALADEGAARLPEDPRDE